MSFSYEVKKELCASISDRDKKYSCFYGMLLFSRSFSAESVIFQTEHDTAAKLFCALAEDVTGEKNIVKKREAAAVSLKIEARAHREKILSMYHVSEPSGGIIRENIGNNSIFAFLAGAFIACGSVADPLKEYHLEFSVQNIKLAGDLSEMINSLGIPAKSASRKDSFIVYMKGSEAIEDFLTLMGASMSTVELMNTKILKDIRNKANRIANCDSANIGRTLTASERQISDIELIISKKGIDFLPEDLLRLAELRLEYPEMSLKELGEELPLPLGRSGVNHRFKRIEKIADDLK